MSRPPTCALIGNLYPCDPRCGPGSLCVVTAYLNRRRCMLSHCRDNAACRTGDCMYSAQRPEEPMTDERAQHVRRVLELTEELREELSLIEAKMPNVQMGHPKASDILGAYLAMMRSATEHVDMYVLDKGVPPGAQFPDVPRETSEPTDEWGRTAAMIDFQQAMDEGDAD